MVLLTENWLARGSNSRSSEITEMVHLIYLRYFLKVALIIILKSPLSLLFFRQLAVWCLLCVFVSSTLWNWADSISSVFLGWTLPGTDLPQLYQSTDNAKGIKNSLLLGNLSISQTEPAVLEFGFSYFAHLFQEFQMHKAFKHSLPSVPNSLSTAQPRDWTGVKHRESCAQCQDALLLWGQLPRQ